MNNLVGRSLARLARRTLAELLLPVLVCAIANGCKQGPAGPLTVAEGREAVKSMLEAWQSGQPAKGLETASPAIQVGDPDYVKGKKLASYEILSEETQPDGKPLFAVRLQFSQPPLNQEVRYVVDGHEDRRWVYREEEFKNARGWKGMK
jgi:hypothetical protein